MIAETRMLLELELVEPSLGWRQLDDDHAGPGSSASSRSASNQPWSGSGSVRSRIDAHSAAVAAVQAAAPAHVDRHQRGGHAGEELHGADETLGAHQRQQHAQPQHDRPRGACTASSPKPRPTTSAR